MKNYLLVLIILLPLLAYTQSNTKIYLKITEEIPLERVNDIECYVQFSHSQNSKVSDRCEPEIFVSPVYAGQRVKWRKNSDLVGNIKKIKIIEVSYKEREGNVDVLEDRIMDRNFWGNVNGKVKSENSGNKKGDMEYYSITFEVKFRIDNVNHWETYTIDPVLKYHNSP